MLAKVIELGDSKQIITADDLPFIITDVLENRDLNHVRLVDCKSISSLNEDAEVELTLIVDDVTHTEKGSGNGGFDAFINALDKILSANTNIERPSLIDYQVHIPRGGKTDALTEAAITWQLNNNKKITTRGVHSNQLFSAIYATLKVINTSLS